MDFHTHPFDEDVMRRDGHHIVGVRGPDGKDQRVLLEEEAAWGPGRPAKYHKAPVLGVIMTRKGNVYYGPGAQWVAGSPESLK